MPQSFRFKGHYKASGSKDIGQHEAKSKEMYVG